MNDYCIQVHQGRIAVSRIFNGQLEPIRFRGENWLLAADFWPSFLDKIEYSTDEKIAFLVLSDDESFSIDPAITVAEQFQCTGDELSSIVSMLSGSASVVCTYPEVNLCSSVVARRDQEADEQTLDEPATVVEGSLQAFFRRKTEEYKHG